MCDQFTICDWLKIDDKWRHIVFTVDKKKGEYYAFVDGVKQSFGPTREKEDDTFPGAVFTTPASVP